MGEKIIFIIIFTLLFFNINAQATDKILAIVNKDIITQSEADAYLNVIILQLSQQYTGEELEERIADEKKELIQKIIEDKIILQEAKSKGLQVPLDRVKQRIDQMKNDFISEDEFEKALRQKYLTIKELENRLSDQILMREIIEIEVKNKIVLSPEEVTAFYEKNKAKFIQAEQRVVDSFYAEDDRVLERLSQDLKGGVGLEAVVKQYDVIYTKDTLSKQEVRGEIASDVFSLDVDGVTKPIQIGKGYYIFRLAEIIQPKLQDLAAAHNKICSYLFQEKFAQKMDKWLEDLKAKSYIEIK